MSPLEILLLSHCINKFYSIFERQYKPSNFQPQNMKKLTLLISIFLLAASALTQSTWPVFINGIYYSESNGEAVVISGEYPDGYPTGTIVIPDHITVNNQDHPVTTLSSSSLHWIKNGQILVLPSSITAIGSPYVDSGTLDSTPRYFNIQGIEVNRPANGDIYIRRTGTKTQKIIF